MADLHRPTLVERDIDQAITALKKGAYLLKYGRRGKPKFCPFRLSTDESTLIWYYGKDEKQLQLRQVSKIIPGQRTAIFQRYPRPEKEYQSFSLIYNDRSLDLICKDKEEAEVWFLGLKALIARGGYRKIKNEARTEITASDSPRGRRVSPSSSAFDQGDSQRTESLSQTRLGKAFADIIAYTATAKSPARTESVTNSTNSLSSGPVDNSNSRTSGADTYRVSLSSAVSSSSQGSCNEDFDSLGDVFIWGEGTGDGVVGGGVIRVHKSSNTTLNALLPKALESTVVLDVHSISCGDRHAVLVTKHGDVFSWGEERGGRLGHGVEADISHPRLIETLCGMNVEMVACGEFHTCAVTLSGDLYSWGDGTHYCGLLGLGSEASHWIPKKVCGIIEGLHVSFIACGPWHTALITSAGQLFTFGDGTFGALGHGNCNGTSIPREVENLKGLRAVRVACGVWHTAAVVDTMGTYSNSRESDVSLSGKLFTWGSGDKGRLGHGDNESRLVPECIDSLVDVSFSQVACGNNLTIALTTSGRVYTMGSNVYGRLTNPVASGKTPTCIEGKIADIIVEEIACGSHHAAVLTSKAEVYTWGKGSNGQLGHGDNDDRSTPTLVDFLKEKQVKSVACGSNFTAVICRHKWLSSADNSICSGCHNPFNFRRKRHNCYNCGLVFCNACSSRKSLKASLAPSMNKPYRVCDDCFTKLQKLAELGSVPRLPNVKSGSALYKPNETPDSVATSRLPGNISRLSSVDSFKSERSSTYTMRSESNDNRVFPLQNGNVQRASISKNLPASPYRDSKKFTSFSVPTSRMVSRSPSPLPGRSSPLRPATVSPTISLRTSEVTPDYIRSTNDSLSQEVKYLKAQVEELAKKSKLLEAELETKSKKLQEVTAHAADEAEKSKAAKEVIKTLTSQLKEMAERVSKERNACNNFSYKNAELMQNDIDRPSNGSSVTSVASPKSELSDGLTPPPLSNGTKVQKSERIIQEEPGVYLTLSSLQNGVNELRRVRFSRKRFTEEQAEKWWAENETRVCEKHKIQTMT